VRTLILLFSVSFVLHFSASHALCKFFVGICMVKLLVSLHSTVSL
jgi:hypothetical protein